MKRCEVSHPNWRRGADRRSVLQHLCGPGQGRSRCKPKSAGANTTGTTNFTNPLFAKRLQLLREVVPKAKLFAFLVNPNNPNAEPDAKDVQAAATVLGVELRVLAARNEAELEVAFAAIDDHPIPALPICLPPFSSGFE